MVHVSPTTFDTVPAWVAQTFLTPLAPAVAEQLEGCGVQVGERVELDLGAAAGVLGEGTCDALRRYAQACRDFFDTWVAGGDPGPWVVVRRTLVSVRQQDTKQHRVDLGGHLEAAADIPLLGEVLDLACGADPDWDEVRHLGEAAGVAVLEDGNETTVELSLPTATVWPELLGGVPTRGELSRTVTAVVNHAAWRDRRNRRLVQLEVVAEEMWPDPAPLRAGAGR